MAQSVSVWVVKLALLVLVVACLVVPDVGDGDGDGEGEGEGEALLAQSFGGLTLWPAACPMIPWSSSFCPQEVWLHPTCMPP